MFEFNHYYTPKCSLFHGILMHPGTYFSGHRISVQIQTVIFPWSTMCDTLRMALALCTFTWGIWSLLSQDSNTLYSPGVGARNANRFVKFNLLYLLWSCSVKCNLLNVSRTVMPFSFRRVLFTFKKKQLFSFSITRLNSTMESKACV